MSTVTLTHSSVTPQEYLERERAAPTKSEYLHGEIVAMAAGGSPEHNVIVANLIQQLLNCLEDDVCYVYPSDMRVWIPATQVYTYPDASIICDEPLFGDERRDNLLNPLVIVEVLSASTADYDRGRKFENYKSIVSLREYVLVWQDEPRIEIHRRVSEDNWQPEMVSGLDSEILVATVGCRLVLSRVYRRIPFPAVSGANGAR